MAWGGTTGSTGEIWTAHTGTSLNDKGDVNLYHGVIMATAMERPFDITPTNTGLKFNVDVRVLQKSFFYGSFLIFFSSVFYLETLNVRVVSTILSWRTKLKLDYRMSWSVFCFNASQITYTLIVLYGSILFFIVSHGLFL